MSSPLYGPVVGKEKPSTMGADIQKGISIFQNRKSPTQPRIKTFEISKIGEVVSFPSREMLSHEVVEQTGFRSLGLNSWLCENIASMGIATATPVQRGCIPAILAGRDIIGVAQTGTGKTAAFALPILQILGREPYGIFCLCLTPTRELASQISEQFIAFSAGMTLRCETVFGGENIRTQAKALMLRPHIAVATPGRLMDHFLHCSAVAKCFENIRCLVLDEADRLLDPGFEAELQAIMHNLPSANRQTLMFSATITKSISAVQELALGKALLFEALKDTQLVGRCKEEYCFIAPRVKEVYLVHILKRAPTWGTRSMIVFAGTVRKCQMLKEILSVLGINCVALHAAKKQARRHASLSRFKSGEIQIMIATDIASRGLDIPTVDMVVNYDVPSIPRDYIHRIGRTARAGRVGRAITLVTQHDISLVHQIEQLTCRKLVELSKLSEEAILKDMAQVFAARRVANLNMGAAGGFNEILRQKRSKCTK